MNEIEGQVIEAVVDGAVSVAEGQDPKQVMYNTINAHYGQFMSYISSLGLEARLVDHAFTNFCQGMMWTEQAIKALVVKEAMHIEAPSDVAAKEDAQAEEDAQTVQNEGLV